MDGVFLFEDVAVEDNKTTQGYDAIVVEQWTVLKVCFFALIFIFNKSKRTKIGGILLYFLQQCIQVMEVKGSVLTVMPG